MIGHLIRHGSFITNITFLLSIAGGAVKARANPVSPASRVHRRNTVWLKSVGARLHPSAFPDGGNVWDISTGKKTPSEKEEDWEVHKPTEGEGKNWNL